MINLEEDKQIEEESKTNIVRIVSTPNQIVGRLLEKDGHESIEMIYHDPEDGTLKNIIVAKEDFEELARLIK